MEMTKPDHKSMCQKLCNAFAPPVHSLQRRFTFGRSGHERLTTAAASTANLESTMKLDDQHATKSSKDRDRLVKIQSTGTTAVQMPASAAPPRKSEKPRRSYTINQRVDDFIVRTRAKLRSASGVGRHA
ncbi:hypothetical protein AXF42_Ash000688 [Apostasia shenzhenica]|uniref:Uncharacterized protein n=1 Tax=Apostasia shenzhenica TaxID=1088818 RepID=A0A2I0AH16_9ASPA|nr:hypothetical protein AXF42_Ash000688 [Apostasia shenzhenica]